MARFDPNPAGIKAWARSDDMRDGLHQLVEPIQDEAARTTALEAVDTGLMAASWKIEPLLTPQGWMVRIWNSAQSEDGYEYPVAQEFGWRTQSGSHVEGKRILGRALGANLR